MALTAWTWPGAGGYRPLPPLNLACSGIAPNAARDEWTRLAEEAADAGGLPAKRDLLGAEDTLISAPLRNSLGALHDLFAQAPVLGSLSHPRALQADLYQHDYESVRELLGAVLEKEGTNDEQTERAVAAQGMARAAELLAGRYHLAITNVPYLARGKQTDPLKRFAKDRHPEAKADLATLFVSRAFDWLDTHGVQALVTPQNWLFLTSYRKLREKLLKQRTWNLVARLGPGAFETIGGHVVNVALNVLSADRPTRDWRMAGIDASAPRGQRPIRAGEKAALLRDHDHPVTTVWQNEQLMNPDAHILLRSEGRTSILGDRAACLAGIMNGDSPRFRRLLWEFPELLAEWVFQQGTVRNRVPFGGRSGVIYYDEDNGHLREDAAIRRGQLHDSDRRGNAAWRMWGVAISQMHDLPVTIYTGEKFDSSTAVVFSKRQDLTPAIWAFCSSTQFALDVRRVNQKVSVENGYFEKVPFDIAHWRQVATEQYPNGLPDPYTDDPTQWIFHGHPCGSVVWHEEVKQTAHGPRRINATVLQVAVARLLGYRWPAEQDPEMRLAGEMRTWVDRCRSLDRFADAAGIVCLAPVSGESAAADRLRLLLAAAYGDDWSAATERQLLAAAAPNGRPAESIEEWLRDRFFEEHCRLFRQRPFVWHVWDGRRDGFHALLNYHRLAGPDSEGRRTLEALTYRHLGDWLARQKADRDHGAEGADGRLAAAQDLQNQLMKIMAGEPPCDLFVRWKPLGEQPIGWEPDINDGVRLNIRPFMSAELTRGGRAGAGILRAKPKIAWNKDRGKEALKPRQRWTPPWLDEGDDQKAEVDETQELRPREEYPWFWSCPGDGTQAERTGFPGGPDFDGNRWNDLHYTNAVKRAARSSRTAEATR